MTKTSTPPYAVRRFWNEAYDAGTRITFGGGTFHFHASTPPFVRLAAAGNRFGVFPALAPVDPPPWVLDGIEEHNGRLIAWLSVEWPKRLQAFAYHVLICDHELRPLIRYAASIGECVDGWVGLGGWIPHYYGSMARNGEYRIKALPAILRDYQEVRFG